MFYFQLNTMVGPDIREIYETKLRDWHLQKDPNFRWCAHVSIYSTYILQFQGPLHWKPTLKKHSGRYMYKCTFNNETGDLIMIR